MERQRDTSLAALAEQEDRCTLPGEKSHQQGYPAPALQAIIMTGLARDASLGAIVVWMLWDQPTALRLALVI